MQSSKNMRGTRVNKTNGRKIGKIKEVLFAPRKQQVIGYLVSRGDLLLMFKRKDKFLAYDRADFIDGNLYASDKKETWDDAALKRLNYSLADSIIWRNMPVRSEDGREVGFVSDLAYDEKTGKLYGVRLSDGALATTLLGRKDIPSELILKCNHNGVIVRNSALGVEASGGVVDTAAQATAIAGDRITKAAKVTKDKVTETADMVRKRTDGMFSSFKEEFQKGMKNEDE